MAEIEPGVLTGQCLNRRIDDIRTIERETLACRSTETTKKLR